MSEQPTSSRPYIKGVSAGIQGPVGKVDGEWVTFLPPKAKFPSPRSGQPLRHAAERAADEPSGPPPAPQPRRLSSPSSSTSSRTVGRENAERAADVADVAILNVQESDVEATGIQPPCADMGDNAWFRRAQAGVSILASEAARRRSASPSLARSPPSPLLSRSPASPSGSLDPVLQARRATSKMRKSSAAVSAQPGLQSSPLRSSHLASTNFNTVTQAQGDALTKSKLTAAVFAQPKPEVKSESSKGTGTGTGTPKNTTTQTKHDLPIKPEPTAAASAKLSSKPEPKSDSGKGTSIGASSNVTTIPQAQRNPPAKPKPTAAVPAQPTSKSESSKGTNPDTTTPDWVRHTLAFAAQHDMQRNLRTHAYMQNTPNTYIVGSPAYYGARRLQIQERLDALRSRASVSEQDVTTLGTMGWEERVKALQAAGAFEKDATGKAEWYAYDEETGEVEMIDVDGYRSADSQEGSKGKGKGRAATPPQTLSGPGGRGEMLQRTAFQGSAGMQGYGFLSGKDAEGEEDTGAKVKRALGEMPGGAGVSREIGALALRMRKKEEEIKEAEEKLGAAQRALDVDAAEELGKYE